MTDSKVSYGLLKLSCAHIYNPTKPAAILQEDQQKNENNEDDGTEDPTQEEHDPYFEPVIMLPEVHIHSLEEDEEALVKLRAKLFRYDKSEETHQWKERGTGEIKILWHNEKHTVRVLMRRDKTWKICANHYGKIILIIISINLFNSFMSGTNVMYN